MRWCLAPAGGSATHVSDCHARFRERAALTAPSFGTRDASTLGMVEHRNLKKKAADAGRRLQGIVNAALRRFQGVRAELVPDEASASERDADPVVEAGVESFPASDPPSFTPEKST